jgi:tRNA-splicing ligase RtcB (3'-phosphate/5'-hydroxy nucleic acid ligase)
MNIKRIDPYCVEIPRHGDMNVPGRIFADQALFDRIGKEESLNQVVNVAKLPGIVGCSLGMPDIHWGYGFPIGGVAAFDLDEGIISPGGVGYDINCGCRLMSTALTEEDVRPRLRDLIEGLYRDIPTGVGATGPLKLSPGDMKHVLVKGAAWAVSRGYGQDGDIVRTEAEGALDEADPAALSNRARERGANQLGTLGSGNHFIELDVVEDVYDHDVARAFGLFRGQVTVMLHSGSRGLGHQVCDDFLKSMTRDAVKYGIKLPDRQLAAVPAMSPEGRRYFGAMAAAANFAWANRQVIMHWTRESIMHTLGRSPRDLKMNLLYDVAHNIAKKEQHMVDDRRQWVMVHRKGATRAFPAGHLDVPDAYRHVGQPVLIPGDMGRASYVLVGSEGSMTRSFGSCCHGAGRVLSRKAALKAAKGRAIHRELEDDGIVVRASGRATLAEEMPEAYKDVSHVVEVVHQAGLARKVVRLRPIGVIKG